ncbi:unnamed protein product [Cylicostephanus goldi]|uniref:Uncharacterized protein n=1 Tax=Cylicostephanus goldi TaxID=71465 RepID=A0A3P7NHR7_CYLGO|nr:unnamed protein product [Cylicostephanus goldi]
MEPFKSYGTGMTSKLFCFMFYIYDGNVAVIKDLPKKEQKFKKASQQAESVGLPTKKKKPKTKERKLEESSSANLQGNSNGIKKKKALFDSDEDEDMNGDIKFANDNDSEMEMDDDFGSDDEGISDNGGSLSDY